MLAQYDDFDDGADGAHLREARRSLLSAPQVKSMLATTVSNHLHKLNRVAALVLADGISAADGRRADLITGWALRLKAARGPNAVIEAACAGLEPFKLVEIERRFVIVDKPVGFALIV